jgi:hypothetical protein
VISAHIAEHTNASLRFQHLSRRALHPQLRVPSMRQLELKRQRLRVLALWCGVYKDRLEMERRHLRRIVGADLHGEKAI